MKLFLKLVAFFALLGFVVPVVNLIQGHPHNTLVERTFEDPGTAKVAHLLANRCGVCHTTEHDMPFYATFPVVRGWMKDGTEGGLAAIDLEAALFPPEGGAPSADALDRLARVVEEGSMPPYAFLVVHWNGHLTEQDKTTLEAWIARMRKRDESGPPPGAPLAPADEGPADAAAARESADQGSSVREAP